MRMSIFGLEKAIEFIDNKVNVLEVYNKKMFCSLIELLNKKCNGEETENNEIVLNEKDENISFDKNAFIITDLFNIEYNSKKILNKLYGIIENNVENRQDYELEQINLKLRNYLIEEINELPFEFSMNDELQVSDLLKAYNLKIDIGEYVSIVDKIEFIINIITTLKIASILIIPNLKVFLNDKEIIEIYKYSIYNDIKLLIIENNRQDKLLQYENKNVIDEEFDEF